nr:glycoside hydrolase family 2 TIM barrel-domain containing protein [uncultured Erythrobacter sp.]
MRQLAWHLCLLGLAILALPAQAHGPDFNRGWQFQRSDAPFDTAVFDPDQTEPVDLPHTPRIEPRIVNDQWQGTAFYRKTFIAPKAWRGQTVYLRFEAAMNVARVSVNGTEVTTHLGGWLPFTLDLTPHLRPGGRNEILVRLDNRDNPITGPKPLAELDFSTYGGLYRGIRLFVKPPVHLSDEMLADKVAGGELFVTYPLVTGDQARIAIAASLRNAADREAVVTVQHRLFDGRALIGETRGKQVLLPLSEGDDRQEIRLSAPKLWSPRSPHLYRLVTEVIDDRGRVDRSERQIGVRQFAFTADGQLLINGEPTFLRGVNRHQEYPYVGYALSPQADYRDAKLIKEAGFDYVRLSHYPHSSAFMAAADALGLVLIDAIPGWQFHNPDPAFEAQVLQTCRDMIRRDRNHPSVLAWECSLNESAMPKALVHAFDGVVEQEYPGAFSAGWQNDGYDIFLQARQHRLQHYEQPDRPYVVSEYGDWEYYAQNAGFAQDQWGDLKEAERTSRQSLGAGEAALLRQATNLQEAHNDNFTTPAFADGYWVMFDYNRGYADDLETSGLMSLERLPKFAYDFFRSQRPPEERSERSSSGPMVRIASHWTPRSSLQVRVFSNGEEVELLLNGRSLGRHNPDQGRISSHLAHPPFTFEVDGFVPGTLEARSYIGGALVAQHRVTTPGPATALCSVLDDGGVTPVIGDLIFLRARLLDADSNPVPDQARIVSFAPPKGYVIVGPHTATAEAGTASVLVRVVAARRSQRARLAAAGLRDVGVCPSR